MTEIFLVNPRVHWCLIHWGRVTYICVDDLTIIGSDSGLSPGQRQAIIWANAGILLIRPLGTNFSEILLEIFIEENVFENVVWKIAAILSWTQCVNQGDITLYITAATKHITNMKTSVLRKCLTDIVWSGQNDELILV